MLRLIFILVCIFILFLYIKDEREYMTVPSSDNKIEPKYNSNILDDSLFTDIVIYKNDHDLYENPKAQYGIDKCISKCAGTCQEFGITGIGYCYPYKI